MQNIALSRELCNIMKDVRITVTQKFIMIAILCESVEQGEPDILELTVKTLEGYGVRGHGHIKPHIRKLQAIGYLLESGKTKREDGYSVTGVRINWNFYQITAELLPNQDIFTQDLLVEENSLEA